MLEWSVYKLVNHAPILYIIWILLLHISSNNSSGKLFLEQLLCEFNDYYQE